jgi:hypothetical protein
LRIATRIEYHEGVAMYTGNLAALALNRERWQDAERLACQALGYAKKVGRQELIASNWRRLAEAFARQGRNAEGLPHAHRAVEIYKRLRSSDLAAAQTTLKECEG